MNPETTQILWGIYTISVMGLGYWVGHRRSREVLRPSVIALEQQISQQKDAESRYQSEIEKCHASGKQIAEQGRALSTIAAAQESPIPPPLMSAIDRLVHATQALSDQLAAAKNTANRESDAVKCTGSVETSPVKPATRSKPEQHTLQSIRPPSVPVPLDFRPPSLEPRKSARSQANLTAQEIVKFSHESLEQVPEQWEETPERYEYTCDQFMAPWIPGDPFPPSDKYRRVTCHDISVRGISFICDERPSFDSLIISVGPRNSPVYMLSEVEDYKAVYMHNQVGYLVSCRFVRRLQIEPAEFSSYAEA